MKLDTKIINILRNKILEIFPDKYNFTHHAQKFSVNAILTDIIYVLNTGVPWKNARTNISGSTLHFHHKRFCKYGVYLAAYHEILDKYFLVDKDTKLKYQYTDTTFITNLNGKDKMTLCGLMRAKKVCRISAITDQSGIPFSVVLGAGNINDSVIVLENLAEMPLKYQVKHKTILADSAYDSNKLRDKLKEMNYTYLIKKNKRNLTDINKIPKMTSDEEKIYKNRTKIENFFCTLKKFKRIRLRSDKTEYSYMGFIHLACMIITGRKTEL